jgi:hypothetical protein
MFSGVEQGWEILKVHFMRVITWGKLLENLQDFYRCLCLHYLITIYSREASDTGEFTWRFLSRDFRRDDVRW